MVSKIRVWIVALTLLSFVGAALPVAAQAPNEITFGSSTPYSGPAASYVLFHRGAIAWFKKVNDEKLYDKKLNFISLDDAYSPPKALEQARKLVEQEKIQFGFMSLGTALIATILPYLEEKKVPLLFGLPGASQFADPAHHPGWVGWLPLYTKEAAIYAKYLLKNMPAAKVGVLYQNDDFGRDFFNGVKTGLGDKAKTMVVAEASFNPTDPTVDSQILNLRNKGSDVLMIFGAPKSTAQALKKAYAIGWKPTRIICSTSTSIKGVMQPAGVEASKGVMSATFMKLPDDPQWKSDPGVVEYLKFAKAYMPDVNPADPFAVTGTLVAQALVHVLKQSGKDLSRENILKNAKNLKNVELPMLVPGVTLNTSPTQVTPISQMAPITFDGEKWVQTGTVIDISKP